MYSSYKDREELEDDLYREEDDNSEGSDADSELEFHLYSQLHYSSNAGEIDKQDKEKASESIQDNHNVTIDISADAGKLEQVAENRPPSRKANKLKGEKNETRTKSDKKKKKTKGQRSSSSSVFEEVIVIDSSPDVITLSEDDSGEDEGVCQKVKQFCTSTPAQQAKKRATGEPVPVSLSSSDSKESESESQSVSDSCSSSDSDDLENWMILGPGQEEGDQSISLNLDGVAESSADVEEQDESWLISDKDRKARIFNKDKGVKAVVQRQLTNRYYTDKNVQCRNCNKTGHLSKNCPEPKKVSACFLCGTHGHRVSECPNKHCNNCSQPGHLYSTCSERAYWHKQCHRCGMTGHFFDACPEIWRQYHITIKVGPPVTQQKKNKGRTPAYCYNCSKKGHFGHDCTRQRMFNGTYPSTPFINYYDTIKDIKCRQHRIKLKFKHLKNNSVFSEVSQSPSTPGPPKKKQKLHHDKSHHQTNHTPRHSFKTNLPASSHIFFIDTSDATSKTIKQNKHKQVNLEKTWKPKVPVPQSRDLPSKAKTTVDEADDFPRGGGQGEEMEKNKKRKKMKKNGRPLCWTEPAGRQGFPTEQTKEKEENCKRRRNKASRKANKNVSAQMYPTDENLFIIKQRKRRR